MSADPSPQTVPADEFTQNFGRYRVKARRGAVAVTSDGRIAGYFMAPRDYEEYAKLKARERSFATDELDDATVRKVARTRMHPRHRSLNAILNDD